MEAPLVLNSSFESWPLKEQTAKILGLPQVAVTPAAQILADGDGWLWFEPAAQRDFPAASQEEALARVQRRAMGSHLRPLLPILHQWACSSRLVRIDMKYIAIAVLLAIFVGAIFYAVNHSSEPPKAEQNTGWMQR
ncbi:MAG: hypothetical protein KDJ28_15725 [Candidatus Competibacteraceae bacterium]|nr:hypothetical protein [Candidatus Competibacteraceae bacterium]